MSAPAPHPRRSATLTSPWAVDPPAPKWLYPALFLAVVLVYWGPRIFRGFWVDEALLYWFVHDGIGGLWRHAAIIPSESILYSLISFVFVSDGPLKEALLRIPAVAAMLLSVFIVYRLAETVAGRGAGWLAAIPFACAGAIVETATNARPYSLALAVTLASFWALREWVRTGRGAWLAGYCAASSAIVYLHYLFALAFVVQTIYLLAARRVGRDFVWNRIIGAGALIAAAALPLAMHALKAVDSYQVWGRAKVPELASFACFYPLAVALPAALGVFLYLLLHPKWFGRPAFPALDDAVLLLTWLFTGPALLFVVARTSSYMLFATRYMVWALPPFFIVLAWCVRQIGPERARFVIVVGVALSAAFYVPQMRMNEWRTPIGIARNLAGVETPVLVRSGIAQSSALDWKSGPAPDSYLFAPLTSYPLPNPIIPVPFFVNAEAERYLEEQIQRRDSDHHQFCLLAESGSDVLDMLPRWFQEHGYAAASREASGFTILLFQRRR